MPKKESDTHDDTFLMSIHKHELNPQVDRKWRDRYVALVQNLKKKPTAFELKQLHEATQVVSDYSSLSRSIETLPFEKASRIIDYIFDNDIILWTLAKRNQFDLRSHVAVFHGLREFLEIDDIGLQKSMVQLPGAYQIWRRSVSIPGDYVKGAIFIEKDAQAHALKVEMIQRFDPREQLPDNPVRGRQETLSGYIFRQSDGRYVMMLRQVGRKHLRVSFFTEVAYEHSDHEEVGPVDWMQGVVMGLDNNKPIMATIYVERVSNETRATGDASVKQLLRSINVYNEGEVPENIRKKLQGRPLHQV